MSAAGSSTGSVADTVVHITVPLTGDNAAVIESVMPSIVHSLEATRARLVDQGQGALRVRLCVTLGGGATANIVRHPFAPRARATPAAARARDLEEIVWWLTYVQGEVLRVAKDCDGASGQLEDTSGSTALVTHAVKALVKRQCTDSARDLQTLRDHLLYTLKYLTTNEGAVAAQKAVDDAPVDADAPPQEMQHVATVRADVQRGVTWTSNPVLPTLCDEEGRLKMDHNAWRAFVPEAMHATTHFANAAAHRDMPTPMLSQDVHAAVTSGVLSADDLRKLRQEFTGFDMLLVQLMPPWTSSEYPLRSTPEVFTFGQCAAQYMMRMLRHPQATSNDVEAALTSARVWASRDASRASLLPEGVSPPRVVHWNMVPHDAPWTAPDARKFARTLNTAATKAGYPAGCAPVVAVFFPTPPPPENNVQRALSTYAPNVLSNTPPLVTVDEDDEEDDDSHGGNGGSATVESKGNPVDEPTPLEVALCSVAALSL